jgi:hypothetical protein
MGRRLVDEAERAAGVEAADEDAVEFLGVAGLGDQFLVPVEQVPALVRGELLDRDAVALVPEGSDAREEDGAPEFLRVTP